MRVLDIGCGPADILAHLPHVEYYGFDISELYIQRARARFADRHAKFACKLLTSDDLSRLPRFDRVIAIGLLHHLGDEMATELMRMVSTRLAPGGRLVTLDPCLSDDQNLVSRWLVKSDRGQNVRTREGYAAIARGASVTSMQLCATSVGFPIPIATSSAKTTAMASTKNSPAVCRTNHEQQRHH